MVRIAHCDDSMIQQEMLKQWLNFYMIKKGVSLESFSFSSGDELLESVKNGSHYDVFLMDIILPGKRGTEIASALRKMVPDAKIIFMTATSAFAHDEAVDGAVGYLAKPINYETLYMLLDTALGRI